MLPNGPLYYTKLSTLKVLQDDRFDQEHRELLADVLLGDVDVYLRGVLDKSWFDGGKNPAKKKLWDFSGCET